MDRHTDSRLKKEIVIWLVTASRAGRPMSVPVWFLWDGKSFLVYSVDGLKVRNIQANPQVELHLNSDEVGADLVRVSGEATIRQSPRADKVPAYIRKYRGQLKGMDMTPEDFSKQYRNRILIRRLRYH